MNDIFYSPEHLQNSYAELERIHRKFLQTMRKFEGLMGTCPGEIAASSSVRSAHSRAMESAYETERRFTSLAGALMEIENIYSLNDDNVEEITQSLSTGILPEGWFNLVFTPDDVEAYINSEYEYSQEETTALFSSELEIPDWMMEEIVKEKLDL